MVHDWVNFNHDFILNFTLFYMISDFVNLSGSAETAAFRRDYQLLCFLLKQNVMASPGYNELTLILYMFC